MHMRQFHIYLEDKLPLFALQIKSKLYRRGVKALRTTEFCQGRTSRWAIAWSFVAAGTDDKPLERGAANVPRPISAVTRNICHEIEVCLSLSEWQQDTYRLEDWSVTH